MLLTAYIGPYTDLHSYGMFHGRCITVRRSYRRCTSLAQCERVRAHDRVFTVLLLCNEMYLTLGVLQVLLMILIATLFVEPQ